MYLAKNWLREDAAGSIGHGNAEKLPAIGNLIRTGNWQQVYSAMETQSREACLRWNNIYYFFISTELLVANPPLPMTMPV